MATMTKTFDAVEMSRQLREQTGHKLWSMSREQRQEYLRQATERYRNEIKAHGQAAAALQSQH
jgi:hypothetical protein